MVIPPLWSMTEIAQWSNSWCYRRPDPPLPMPRPSRKVSSKAHTQSAVSGVIASSGGDRACDYPPPRMFYIKTAADPVVAAQASGISLPPPDKFVGLTMVPCGGMPHDPAEEDGAWRTSADEPITGASDAGHEAARNPVSRTQRTMAAL